MRVAEGVVAGFTAFLTRRPRDGDNPIYRICPACIDAKPSTKDVSQLSRANTNVATRALRHLPTLKFSRILASWRGQQNRAAIDTAFYPQKAGMTFIEARACTQVKQAGIRDLF